ncbi:immunodominant virion protein, partial [Fowlpox virus]
WISPTRTIVIV